MEEHMNEQEQKQFLDEEKYQKYRKIVLRIGFVGLIMFGIGLIGSIIVFYRTSIAGILDNSWLSSIFIPMTMFGLFITIVSFANYYSREISGYAAQGSLPVQSETFNKSTEKITPGIKTIASAIVEGSGNVKKAQSVETLKNKLLEIEELKDEKLISEEEYEKLRQKLLKEY